MCVCVCVCVCERVWERVRACMCSGARARVCVCVCERRCFSHEVYNSVVNIVVTGVMTVVIVILFSIDDVNVGIVVSSTQSALSRPRSCETQKSRTESWQNYYTYRNVGRSTLIGKCVQISNLYRGDPNTKRFKRTLIYFNTDTQYAHFRGNPFHQATKRYLNNR